MTYYQHEKKQALQVLQHDTHPPKTEESGRVEKKIKDDNTSKEFASSGLFLVYFQAIFTQ